MSQHTSEQTPLLATPAAPPLEGVAAPPNASSARPSTNTTDAHLRWFANYAWYRRPSDLWLRPFIFILAAAAGLVMAPRQEVYTQLVCHELHLDYSNATTGVSTAAQQHVKLAPITQSTWSSSSSTDSTASTLALQYVAHASSSPTPLPPVSKEPSVAERCRVNPKVQAGLAALQLKIGLAMGITAVVTTGFWGALSDRAGRLIVLRISIVGFILNDLCYLTVTNLPTERVPFGSHFLILGSLFEGLFGSFATLAAANQAYISDVSSSGSKARTFSIFTGVLFLGFSCGPMAGGLLAKYAGDLATPFWVALAAHLVYLFFCLLVLPESVSPERKAAARAEWQASKQVVVRAATDQEEHDKRALPFYKRAAFALLAWSRPLLVPLQPIVMLLPRRKPAYEEVNSSSNTRAHPEASASHISVSHVSSRSSLDWNLTLLSLGYFVEASVMGIIQPKLSYAQQNFNWSSAELGYFISFGGFARVFALTLVIPLVIKRVHRPSAGVALPQDEGAAAALLDDEGRQRLAMGREEEEDRFETLAGNFSEAAHDVPEHAADTEELWLMRAKHLRLLHDSAFDRRLALVSILIDAASYALLVVTHGHGPVPYCIATALTSLGGAAPAAMSSLALALLPNETDAGKLFAAWAIMSALASQIFGPAIFLFLREITVDTSIPQAIFALGALLYLISTLIASFVRVRKPHTLPALPARPHTQASRAKAAAGAVGVGVSSEAVHTPERAMQAQRGTSKQQQQQQLEDESPGPESSTRSKLRMKPMLPWKGNNQDSPTPAGHNA